MSVAAQPISPPKWGQDEYLSPEEILRRVRALGPIVEEDAAAIEREQKLTDRVREGLVAAGAFRIGFAAEWGGPEMRLEDQVQLLADLGYHDASAAWNVTIMADAGMFASLLPHAVAQEIYPSMDMPTAATMHPIGRAEKVEGGYKLNGRWSFGSGVRNCDRAVASFHKYDGDQAELGPDGKPAIFMAWVPSEAITTYDTWHTTGMCGSGSTGWSVTDLVLPESYLFPFADTFGGSQSRHRLMRYYAIFAANQIGVALGATKRALDELQKYLESGAKNHHGQPLKSDKTVLINFAEAQGLWSAAHYHAKAKFAEVSDLLMADVPLSAEQEASLTSVPVIGARLCWDAINLVMEIFGSRSILRDQPYERIFRDMATAVRHRYFRRDHLELAGRQLLGEEVDPTMAG